MTIEKEIKLKKGLGILIGIMLFAIAALGITYAYFAGSVSSNTNSITSTESIAINYRENKDYMFSGLIPSSLENALIGASKVENKCMDDNNYYVCSLYEFTVDNISNVSQDIEVYLYQQINGYTNLKYEVYETSINDSNFDNEHKVVNSTSLVYPDSQNELGTKIDGLTKTLSKVDNSVTTDSVTYTLMLYVENKDYNQSGEDGGKQIVADIHVVSKASSGLTSGDNSINIPETFGILQTQVKYYYSNNIDYIVFYDDYAIAYVPNLMGVEEAVFVGLYRDGESYYYQTSQENTYISVPLTVSSGGSSFSFNIGSGDIVMTKSTDRLDVTYDETTGVYVNTLYYDTTGNSLTDVYIGLEGVKGEFTIGLIKDGNNYSYNEGFTLNTFSGAGNNKYLAGSPSTGLDDFNLFINRVDTSIANNHKSITCRNDHNTTSVLTIRENN